MQTRMTNPAFLVPDALKALMALGTAAANGGVPAKTLELMRLRASQINGCSACVDMHPKLSGADPLPVEQGPRQPAMRLHGIVRNLAGPCEAEFLV